ncbi:hypothetical protein AB4Z17_27565 [Paenibacillus sp. TAF43_2]
MYIQYTMDQLTLPMDLAEDIPENHLVRVGNTAVNRLSDRIFSAAYPGGGRDSYHPKMLTKVIIYAYICDTMRKKIHGHARKNSRTGIDHPVRLFFIFCNISVQSELSLQ